MAQFSSSKKRKLFSRIIKDIRNVKIQGARNIAKKALYAYYLIPTPDSKRKLISIRPTEPMLVNVLNQLGKKSYPQILKHFEEAQEKINTHILKIIRNKDVIFTHCHSTNVISSLKYVKKSGKIFEVYNTETRPLLQGRKTAKELAKVGIKITQFIDSALTTAIEKDNRKDKIYSNKVFLGADALINGGIINKIGSKTIAEISYLNKVPVYIIADSWKFTDKKVPIEQRSLNEIWDKAPKNIKIKNPAFEFIPKKYITKIVSDLGVLSYEQFLRKVKSH